MRTKTTTRITPARPFVVESNALERAYTRYVSLDVSLGVGQQISCMRAQGAATGKK